MPSSVPPEALETPPPASGPVALPPPSVPPPRFETIAPSSRHGLKHPALAVREDPYSKGFTNPRTLRTAGK
jgi:hypothetical protein